MSAAFVPCPHLWTPETNLLKMFTCLLMKTMTLMSINYKYESKCIISSTACILPTVLGIILQRTANSVFGTQNTNRTTKWLSWSDVISQPDVRDKPLSCASRLATVWLWDSLLLIADVSLVCSSAASCFWAEASRRSWESWALDESRSSSRWLWKTRGGGGRRGWISSFFP